jgi:hypothetical protein
MKQVTVHEQGFRIDPHPEHVKRLEKMKSKNQLDRIEAKLDLLLEKMGVKVHE